MREIEFLRGGGVPAQGDAQEPIPGADLEAMDWEAACGADVRAVASEATRMLALRVHKGLAPTLTYISMRILEEVLPLFPSPLPA